MNNSNKRPESMARITTPELAEAFINEQLKALRAQIGDKKVLLALSGGVDSSVVAALLIKAVGKQLVSVHVNHGLMRKGESEQVIEVFRNQLDANLVYASAKSTISRYSPNAATDMSFMILTPSHNMMTTLTLTAIRLEMQDRNRDISDGSASSCSSESQSSSSHLQADSSATITAHTHILIAPRHTLTAPKITLTATRHILTAPKPVIRHTRPSTFWTSNG